MPSGQTYTLTVGSSSNVITFTKFTVDTNFYWCCTMSNENYALVDSTTLEDYSTSYATCCNSSNTESNALYYTINTFAIAVRKFKIKATCDTDGTITYSNEITVNIE